MPVEEFVDCISATAGADQHAGAHSNSTAAHEGAPSGNEAREADQHSPLAEEVQETAGGAPRHFAEEVQETAGGAPRHFLDNFYQNGKPAAQDDEPPADASSSEGTGSQPLTHHVEERAQSPDEIARPGLGNAVLAVAGGPEPSSDAEPSPPAGVVADHANHSNSLGDDSTQHASSSAHSSPTEQASPSIPTATAVDNGAAAEEVRDGEVPTESQQTYSIHSVPAQSTPSSSSPGEGGDAAPGASQQGENSSAGWAVWPGESGASAGVPSSAREGEGGKTDIPPLGFANDDPFTSYAVKHALKVSIVQLRSFHITACVAFS